jgi:hypothetical protein
MMAYVTKADGSRQQFDRGKVVRTCLRMHATPEQAQLVADKVEQHVYDGITTKKILQIIFQQLRKHKPEMRHQIDLREAVVKLRPKPDFEKFVGLLMQEYGYRVFMNQMIDGRCVDHEIDVIAVKGSEVIYVEVKHHLQHHTFTGMNVFLEANSTFEDLKSGHEKGRNRFGFTKAMVVCNTKISDHAKRYAECQGLDYIGWRAPEDEGLERMIEEKRLHPITILKGLNPAVQAKLGDAGIVLLRQLMGDANKLARQTGVPRNVMQELASKAGEILRR